ncbi:MAG: Hsp33 family molecular chaperone HslO [Fibrobacterota bacterium]
MNDRIITALSDSGTLRAVFAITRDTVNEAYRIQQPASLSGVMLGRTLTATALLCSGLKGNDRLSVRLEGNGPLKKLIAEGDASGRVRGFAGNPDLNFTSDHPIDQQIQKSLGIGVMTVVKDLGMKRPYTGTIDIKSGAVGEDFAYYLTESEQIPSAVSVGTIPAANGESVEYSAGFLIQTMPREGGFNTDQTREVHRIHEVIQNLPSVTEMLKSGISAENILTRIFHGIAYSVIDERPLTFSCPCSKERVIRSLQGMHPKSLRELFDGKETLESTCEFCRQTYLVTMNELKG